MITTLPPLTGWTEYAEALDKRDRLAADLRQAQHDLDDLPSKAQAAAKADEDAHASALLAGKPAPTTRKASVKHQADAEALKHHAAALARALELQDAAVLGLLRDDQDRAQQAARDALEDATLRYRQALDGLAEAREHFHAARQTEWWLQDGPGRRRFKPSPAPGLTVPGAVTANGDPLAVGPVLDALNAETGTGPGMVAGPWRGTLVREDEAVRMVRRHRPDFLGDPSGRSSTTYAIRADQVPADEAARREAVAAHEGRQQEQTRSIIARQAATSGQPAPAGSDDPLSDLREAGA